MRQKQINPQSSKVNYRLYSPTALTNAFQAVREQGIPVRKAARLYNIPLTTLRDRIDRRTSIDTISSGPDPILSQEEEARLVDHIKYMSDIGYGYTRAQVLELATDLAVFVRKRDKGRPLSLTWFYNFMGRWPELHVVKPRGLSSIRAKSASPDTIMAYYQELEKIMEKYDLKDKPESMYNIDEKGICTEHKPPNVVSGRDSGAQAITSAKGKNTTIIGCGNALGQQIPPFFVFAGKRKVDHLIEGAIPGTDFDVSDSGWSNSEVFEWYMKEHFTKFVQVRDGEHVLVLYDGHASHVSLPLIEWAKERRIILFLLPPHCSHVLQPLDVGCFGPLERIYNRVCSAYLRDNPGQAVTRLNVCELACKAYSLALSPENLRASFRRSGIYPLDKTAVPSTKLKPSALYQASSVKDNTNDNSKTANNIHATGDNINVNDNIEDSTITDQENKDNRQNSEDTNKNNNNQHIAETVSDVNTFFQDKRLVITNKTQEKDNKRKNLNKLIAGCAITEDETYKKIKEYKESQTVSKSTKPVSSTKSTKNKEKAKKRKAPISAPVDQIPPPSKSARPDSQEPGPSKYYVDDSDSLSDIYSSDSDSEGDCCVCKKNSPPGLKDCLDLAIVNWAQCDKCDHWTHLRFCSTVRVVRRHSEFLCPHCLAL